VDLDIEVKWTKEDIENRLLEEMRGAGLTILPKKSRKKKKGDEKKDGNSEDEEGEDDEGNGKYFTWTRGGKVIVKARAMTTLRKEVSAKPDPAKAEEEDAEEEDAEEAEMSAEDTQDELERIAQESANLKRARSEKIDGESKKRPN
jgi:hypothetical protein